jgi:hypothetical protein
MTWAGQLPEMYLKAPIRTPKIRMYHEISIKRWKRYLEAAGSQKSDRTT